MSKNLVLFVLVFSLTAFAQHGRGGSMGGGRPAGVGAPSGVGNAGSGHGMGGTHDTGVSHGPSGTAGAKSPDDLLQQNTKLASKLKDLGVTSCTGFKNLGQCVAAAHVSNNLGISFDKLKADMDSGMSLGKAIQTEDPNVNAKQEAEKARKQANRDLNESKS